MKLGQYLRDLREEANLTQEQIAHKFGASQAYYNKIERGKVIPPASIPHLLILKARNPKYDPIVLAPKRKPEVMAYM